MVSEKLYKFFNVMVHLGSESPSARIATFYTLYHLLDAEPVGEPNLRKMIFDILCIHLRLTTIDKDYQGIPEPTIEIQNLLDILFNPSNTLKFSDLDVNLARARLQGAELQGVQLKNVNLQNAYLVHVKLQGAKLQGANLQGAELYSAKLQGAYLQYAKLQGAYLRDADLRDADLQGAMIDEKARQSMPGWEDAVKQHNPVTERTGAFLVDDKGKIIENL